MRFVARNEYVDGKKVRVYRIDGRKVSQPEYAREMKKAKRRQARYDAPASVLKKRPGGWPMKSIALAVHPSQVKEATASAKAKGVPTSFTPDGRPIFTSRQHYRDYQRAYNFYNRDAGFGDAAPRVVGSDRD